MLALRTLQRSSRMLATRAASTTPVALVGCGMPGRGMGWYHAKQILDGDVPSATLTDIVEPWFLGGGKDGPGGAEFAAFKAEHEGKVRFHSSIADMPKPDGKMMAMVRTRRLLHAATASTRLVARNDGSGWFLRRFSLPRRSARARPTCPGTSTSSWTTACPTSSSRSPAPPPSRS